MELSQILDRTVVLLRSDAEAVLAQLLRAWNVQAPEMRAPLREREELSDTRTLSRDLASLHYWFNPVASGKRLRESLDRLAPFPGAVPQGLGDLLESVDGKRVLVSPEGRTAMWILEVTFAETTQTDELWPSTEHVAIAWTHLAVAYRDWNRQRLRNVTGLLREETATLRPSVIGLLLVLLINRNTSRERRLPAPKDSRVSRDVNAALAAPALAFANALSGSDRADARGLDLYRGWATGEIARRLGSGLHREDGLWIDADAVQTAEDRLIEALVDRPKDDLPRVQSAIDAALVEYRRMRPILSSLGIAHERPSSTRRLVDKIHRSLHLSHPTLEASQ